MCSLVDRGDVPLVERGDVPLVYRGDVPPVDRGDVPLVDWGDVPLVDRKDRGHVSPSVMGRQTYHSEQVNASPYPLEFMPV